MLSRRQGCFWIFLNLVEADASQPCLRRSLKGMPSSGRADGLFLPCAYLLSGEGIIPIPPKGLSLSLVDAVGTGRRDALLPRQLPCLTKRRYKATCTGLSNCLPLSLSVRKWRNKISSQLGTVLSQPAAEGTVRHISLLGQLAF